MAAKSIYGSDGLIAREAGEYARRKLAFIDFFCPPAIDATAKKIRRVYLDLFAGPGLNLVREGGDELEGGALRVLRSHGERLPDLSFTHAYLVNLDPESHDALRRRVDRLVEAGVCMVPGHAIHHELGDANALVGRLLLQCHPLDYVLTFADIEAPSQLPWSTVEAIGASTHQSLDLYVLFPLEMGLNRLTTYGQMKSTSIDIFNRFYGNESWRPILDRRITKAQAADCLRSLEELYIGRLGSLWKNVVRVMRVQKAGRGLYRMIFATNHEAGDKVAAWAKGKAEWQDQFPLEGF